MKKLKRFQNSKEMPKAEKRCKVKEKFPCEVCGVVLSSSYNLRIHLETKCSTIKNFDCGVCSSKFLTQHSLKTHVNSLHFGEKKFLCSFCTSKFLSKGQLKVHERSHTKEKSFVCQVCQEKTSKYKNNRKKNLLILGLWQRLQSSRVFSHSLNNSHWNKAVHLRMLFVDVFLRWKLNQAPESSSKFVWASDLREQEDLEASWSEMQRKLNRDQPRP